MHISPTKEFTDRILQQANYTVQEDDGFGDFGDFEQPKEPVQDDGFGAFDDAPAAAVAATTVENDDDGFGEFDDAPKPAQEAAVEDEGFGDFDMALPTLEVKTESAPAPV